MKTKLLFTILLGVVVAFSACKDDDPAAELNVPATVAITNDGAQQTITITSNVAWKLTKPNDAAWLTVSPANGDGNNNTVTISATDWSSSAQPRTAVITVTANEAIKTIEVTQAGVDAPGAAGEITITGTFCDNQSAVLSIAAINRATSYQWYKNETAIEGATGLSYTATSHGSYTVAGVNAAGEGAKSPAKVIEQCPLTINDLLGEWTVTEGQSFSPAQEAEEVSYTITIALKEGTTDSITVSGIGNGAGVLDASISTSTIKAKVAPSTDNTMMMSIPAQKVSPKWPAHGVGTVFFAVTRNDASMNPSIVSQNFPDVTITRAADGSISCTLVGSAAPHSYAFGNEMMASFYMMSMSARDTRWVKNAE